MLFCGIHASARNAWAGTVKHDRIFDDISKIIAQPRSDWRRQAHAVALDLGGKLAAGLVIGIGIAVGMALAG